MFAATTPSTTKTPTELSPLKRAAAAPKMDEEKAGKKGRKKERKKEGGREEREGGRGKHVLWMKEGREATLPLLILLRRR